MQRAKMYGLLLALLQGIPPGKDTQQEQAALQNLPADALLQF